MKEIILVCFPVTPAHEEAFCKAAPGYELRTEASALSGEELSRVTAVLGTPSAAFLKKLPNLRWLGLYSAGVGDYIKEEVLPADVLLTNCAGAYGIGIAEHMLGEALMLMKNLHLYRDNQRACLWQDEGGVTTFVGARTLVVGSGDIGTEFARRAKALGSYTVGIRRNLSRPLPAELFDETLGMDSLDEALPGADLVFLSLPETPLTRGLFDAARLGRMKKGAILLNAGRGSAVDTLALADAITSGALRGAALDVTDPEPLPPDHPAWKVKNLLITPHISGGFHLPLTHDRIVAICAENLARFAKGEPLSHQVSRREGY